MGKADLAGKIILEILFVVIFIVFLEGLIQYYILVALLLAHTLNWLLNAHFWDVGRFIGITNTPPSRFFPYLRKLTKRLDKDSSPATAIIIGGISRKQGFRSTSDVDLIFIRDSGVQNSIKAVLVTIRERVMAFFCKFPLHLELYDHMQSLEQHRIDEVPVILKDTGKIAEDWYRKAGREISGLNDYDPNP